MSDSNVTSFYNFISDHISIVIRVSDDEDLLTKEIVEKINFNSEKNYHYHEEEKPKAANEKKEITQGKLRTQFKRRILNPDTAVVG